MLRERPDLIVAAIKEHLVTRLTRFKTPERWFIAGALPMTASGKVQKFKLRAGIEAGEYEEVRE